jgi:hypothetical protein
MAEELSAAKQFVTAQEVLALFRIGNPPPEISGTSASRHGRGDGTWASGGVSAPAHYGI